MSVASPTSRTPRWRSGRTANVRAVRARRCERLAVGAITRRFPAPGSSDAEVTKLAAGEFSRGRPAVAVHPAGAAGTVLRPWIVLVVGRRAPDEIILRPDGRVGAGHRDPAGPRPDRVVRSGPTCQDVDGPSRCAGSSSPVALPRRPNTSPASCLPSRRTAPTPGRRRARHRATCYDWWTFRTGPQGDFPELAAKLHKPISPPIEPGDGQPFGRADVGYRPPRTETPRRVVLHGRRPPVAARPRRGPDPADAPPTRADLAAEVAAPHRPHRHPGRSRRRHRAALRRPVRHARRPGGLPGRRLDRPAAERPTRAWRRRPRGLERDRVAGPDRSCRGRQARRPGHRRRPDPARRARRGGQPLPLASPGAGAPSRPGLGPRRHPDRGRRTAGDRQPGAGSAAHGRRHSSSMPSPAVRRGWLAPCSPSAARRALRPGPARTRTSGRRCRRFGAALGPPTQCPKPPPDPADIQPRGTWTAGAIEEAAKSASRPPAATRTWPSSPPATVRQPRDPSAGELAAAMRALLPGKDGKPDPDAVAAFPAWRAAAGSRPTQVDRWSDWVDQEHAATVRAGRSGRPGPGRGRGDRPDRRPAAAVQRVLSTLPGLRTSGRWRSSRSWTCRCGASCRRGPGLDAAGRR